MKRVIIALLCLACNLEIHAEKKDTVRFVYVLENPKIYGLDKAHSWFEIEGLSDRTVSRIINDTLRKAFFETTGLEAGTNNATMRPDNETPKGFTDYFFWNGDTYGNGWIRFKDSDSLLYLTSASGYYGSGQKVQGFSQEMANGRFAWISIITTRFLNNGVETGRTIDLAFDLRTGKTVPPEYKIRIDPSKRDSLDRLMLLRAQKQVADDDGYHDGKITSADSMGDTVIVYMGQLIPWMRGEKSQYANTICRLYGGTMIRNNEEYIVRPQVCLTLDEAIPFFVKDDWLKLASM